MFYFNLFNSIKLSSNDTVIPFLSVALILSIVVCYELNGVKFKKFLFLVFCVFFLIYAYYILPFITYPFAHYVTNVIFQSIITENFYFCKSPYNYQLVFYNIFDSNICEIRATNNKTDLLYQKILVPKEFGKESLSSSNFNKNITDFVIRCGVLTYGPNELRNC